MTWLDLVALGLLVVVCAGLARGITHEDHRRDRDLGRW